MRKTAKRPFAAAVFVVASMFDLHSATLAGVTLPDTATVGSKSLVLNGWDCAQKYIVKVYVGGLYLEHKST